MENEYESILKNEHYIQHLTVIDLSPVAIDLRKKALPVEGVEVCVSFHDGYGINQTRV